MEAPPQQRRILKKIWDSILGLLEAIFFNVTLKLVALRLLLVAAVVNLSIQLASIFHLGYYGIQDMIYETGPFIFIILHHVISVFKVRYIPRWLDLSLDTAQLVYMSIRRLSPIVDIYQTSLEWDTLADAMTTITLLGICVIVVFLFFCRIAAIIRQKGKNLTTPFDLLEDRPQARISRFPERNTFTGLSLLVGRSLWHNHFLGERLFVRLIRGLMAGCLVIVLVGYGIILIAIQPVMQSAFISTKQTQAALHSSSPLTTFRGIENSWRVVAAEGAWIFYFDTFGGRRFPSQIPLKAINVSVAELQPCDGITRLGFAVFECPQEPNWASSDVLITVDFSMLGTGPMGTRGISVYLSLDGGLDTGLVFRDIVPFPLPRGVNYFATVSVTGRISLGEQNEGPPYLRYLSPPKSYLVPSIRYVVSDPYPPHPPTVVPSNISTLRLSYADTSIFRVEIDQREKTFFSGLAALGGLFTFASGVFALVFGTTFLRVIFDMRELSIFGLAQRWDREKIVKAYFEAYPLLREELELKTSQRGVVAIMQEHLLDLKLFREVLDAEARSTTAIELVTHANDEEERGGLEDRDTREAVDSGSREEVEKFLSVNPSKMVLQREHLPT